MIYITCNFIIIIKIHNLNILIIRWECVKNNIFPYNSISAHSMEPNVNVRNLYHIFKKTNSGWIVEVRIFSQQIVVRQLYN